MANKRALLGTISAAALLLGVGVARSAITTERIVTDDALSMAQQTGQPVWETYQRNVWLAWIGSVVAVAGVSGVAAALYARDEEIEDIADRAVLLCDRLAAATPALRSLMASPAPAEIESSPEPPLKPPLEPEPERDDEGYTPTDTDRPEKAPIDPVAPVQIPEDDDNAERGKGDPNPPIATPDWIEPIILREPNLSDVRTGTESVTRRTSATAEVNVSNDPIATDGTALEPLLVQECDPFMEWDRTQTLEPLNSEGVLEPRESGVDHGEAETLVTSGYEFPEFPDATEPDDSEAHRLEAVSAIEASETAVSKTAVSKADPAIAPHAPLLETLTIAPRLWVCCDEPAAIATDHLIYDLVNRRRASGHQCIVCDPLAAAHTWRGCDRHGHREDYVAIEAALAKIVAEIDTRLSDRQAGQTEFSPLTLACIRSSNWLELCPSASLLAVRTVEAASVAVHLVFVEAASAAGESTLTHRDLGFPEDVFARLDVSTSDKPGELDKPTAAEPQSSVATIGAQFRDPSYPNVNIHQTFAFPSREAPPASLPPMRSLPPMTAPAIVAATTSGEHSGQNPQPNPTENSYPMADTETHLRSQIALFQDIGMTREQIVMAIWNVRDSRSDEYQIAREFYDRLTR